MGQVLDIDLLCRVVDNYGDIGVVFRLARALSELPDPPRLRLLVDGLSAFAQLCPEIDPEAEVQEARGWTVVRWDRAWEGFRSRPPRILVECFACGRPDWLEDILFGPQAELCLVVDLEHLTAEPYAGEFHRMPSLTRSPLVRKAMFLPGFEAGTGGLTMDRDFARTLERSRSSAGLRELRADVLARLGAGASSAGPRPEGRFWVGIFSYERDYARIVADLAAYGASRPLLALVAAGASSDCFLRAWREAGEPFPALSLPFLPQQEWDEVLAACDFSIVRGEDTWSRAALAGKPFLWQAYPQEGRYQMTKVRAFLDRLRRHAGPVGPASAATLGEASFDLLEDLYLSFNDRDRDWPGESGSERLLPVLGEYAELLPVFAAFSREAAAQGDLAANLMTFLRRPTSASAMPPSSG